MRRFDRKFGRDFLASLPREPGIYWYTDEDGRILYVGKAKNLRARLSQYRNANRTRKDRKMRTLVREAARLETRVCATETEALLLENEWIRAHRPPLNVSGAYEFLYPSIGVLARPEADYLVCTTMPAEWRGFGFTLYGSYGSRVETRECFAILIELLSHLGHPEPPADPSWKKVRYSRAHGFRQLDPELLASLRRFLSGESAEFLEELVLRLVEKPRARQEPREIRRALLRLRRFFRDEPERLRRAKSAAGFEAEWVPQAERDRLLILAKGGRDLFVSHTRYERISDDDSLALEESETLDV